MKLEHCNIKKIAIFRALKLGDMLCAVPAFRALRKAFPEAEITLMGLPWAKEFVERFSHYLDSFVAFPGFPGLPEQQFDAEKIIQFFAAVQKKNFDLAVQMHGNGSISNSIVTLFNAKNAAGFYKEKNHYPKYELFLKYPEGIPEIDRNLLLMNHLGIPSQGNSLEFPLNEIDFRQLDELKFNYKEQKYICVHPGSASVSRQWPPEYFARLADYCLKNGFQIILTGGKGEERIAENVEQHMKHKAANVCGKTSLGVVTVLISHAHAILCNCTGVSHIAAAVKTPSIVISMDGEPERWAPLDKNLHRTIDWRKNPDFDLVFDQMVDLLKLPVSVVD